MCVCVCLYAYMSIYLSVYLSLSVYPSIYLSISICIYLYLSVSICIYLYLCVSICIYLYLSISIQPSIHLSISIMCFFISLGIYPYLYLSINLFIFLPVYLSICLSIYLSIVLSFSLSLYLFIYLSLSVHLSISLSVFLLSVYLSDYPSLSLTILPDGSAPAALAGLLVDPPELQSIEKHGLSRLFYLFLHFDLLPSDSFSCTSLPTSAASCVSILSEVWLLNFFRSFYNRGSKSPNFLRISHEINPTILGVPPFEELPKFTIEGHGFLPEAPLEQSDFNRLRLDCVHPADPLEFLDIQPIWVKKTWNNVVKRRKSTCQKHRFWRKDQAIYFKMELDGTGSCFWLLGIIPDP